MGILEWLFGSKKRGLDPDNKYTYYYNSRSTKDIRDIRVFNPYTDQGTDERASINSEEHYPNGKLKKIILRKSVSVMWGNGQGEDEEKRQVIKTFHENGKNAGEFKFLFNTKSSTYKKHGLWTEYDEHGLRRKYTKYENGRRIYEQIFENGNWIDKEQQERDILLAKAQPIFDKLVRERAYGTNRQLKKVEETILDKLNPENQD